MNRNVFASSARIECAAITLSTALSVFALACLTSNTLLTDENHYDWDIYTAAEAATERFLVRDEDARVWILIYDTYARPRNPPEASISLHDLGDELSASITVAEGSNFFVQFNAIAKSSPKVTLEEALSRIRYRRHLIKVSECPRLRDVVAAYNELSFKPKQILLEGDIERLNLYTHERRVRIHISEEARSARFSLVAGTEPLAIWAESARDELLKCIGQAYSDNEPQKGR